MSRTWKAGSSTKAWWIPGDRADLTIRLRGAAYFVTDDRKIGMPDDVLAGPFDTLEVAQAAYLLIGRRT